MFRVLHYNGLLIIDILVIGVLVYLWLLGFLVEMPFFMSRVSRLGKCFGFCLMVDYCLFRVLLEL